MKNQTDTIAKKKRSLKIPDTLIILFVMIVLATIATWIVPAGEFDMIMNETAGRNVADPTSFHYVEQQPQDFLDMLMAIPTSFIAVANLATMNFMCGAAFYLITVTGAINSGLAAAIKHLDGKKRYAMLLVLYGVGLILGLRGGAETLLPFVPMSVTAALAIGLDSMIGVASVMLGGAVGFAVSWLNGAYVTAMGISELPLLQDVWYRVICVIVFTIPVLIYFYIYCEKIFKDPTKSPQYEADKTLDLKLDTHDIAPFTGKRKVIMFIFLFSLVALVVGAIKFGWSINHFSAFYFLLAIIVGVVWGFNMDDFAKHFTKGAATMMYGIMMIGFSRVISTILTDGKILDTCTNAIAQPLADLPAWATATGMFIANLVIDVVVPSGSGQAAVVMPIMAPLADLVGVSRHTAVLALQFGDCFTNAVSPTSGFFMAALAIGGIPWTKWLKWYIPLFAILIVLAAVMLSIMTGLTF